MTHKIKSLLATFALSLLVLGAAAVPSVGHANPQTWDGAGKTVIYQGQVYAPVREMTESLGGQIGWVPYGEVNLLTFTDQEGQAYEISLNPTTGLVQSYNGYYAYTWVEGSVALPLTFYKDHYQNINLSYDAIVKTLKVSLADANKGISFTQLNPYIPPVVEVVAPPALSPAPEAAPAPAQTGVFFESGQASYYGAELNGNYTASGEIFNMHDMTAAHKTLPFGTLVKVTNQYTGASCVVHINDRGPYAHGRVIDLSYAAAGSVGMISSGVAPVTLEILN